MSTKKRVAPELPEPDRLKRQDEAYRLHCRGWSIRAIAAEMHLDTTQVQRAIRQAKEAIREQKGAEHLAELADRLTEGAWEDLADSWRVAALEPVETTEEDPVTGGLTKVKVLAPDFRALAAERMARAKLRELIAKWNGMDPIRQAELEMKRKTADAAERGAAAAEGLLASWAKWDTGDPGSWGFEAELQPPAE